MEYPDPPPIGPYWTQTSPVDSADLEALQPQATGTVDDSETDFTASLARDRRRNDLKLKARFEHIFERFSQDFHDVGDEVDLETGHVVVNNGHLRHMRNYFDLGRERRRVQSESVTSDEEEDSDMEQTKSFDSAEETEDEDATEADEAVINGFPDEEDDVYTSDYESESEVGLIEDESGTADGRALPQFTSSGDVWNDIPPLPGDVGYTMPLVPGARPHFSDTAFREVQNSIEEQLEQFLEDVKQRAGSAADASSQHQGQVPAQITISLDPRSADYGKPLLHYAAGVATKRGWPSNQTTDLHDSKRQKVYDDVITVETPADVAAAVAKRIEAGLQRQALAPNIPRPAVRAQQRIRQKARLDAEGQKGPAAENGGEEQMNSTMPIDPALDELFVGASSDFSEGIQEAAEQSGSGSSYSANTSRPLASNKFDPNPYTDVDSALLFEVKETRKIDWRDVQEFFFPERTMSSLQYQFYTYLKQENLSRWSEQDEALLVELRETEDMTWEVIRRDYFPDHTLSSLQHRFYTKLRPGKNRSWTKEEDELIIELKDVKNMAWPQIQAQHFPDQHIGQIQYRYYNHLRPKDWKAQVEALASAEHEKRAAHRSAMLSGALRRRPRKHWTEEDKEKEKNSSMCSLRGYHNRLAAASANANLAKKNHAAKQKQEREELAARRKKKSDQRKAARNGARVKSRPEQAISTVNAIDQDGEASNSDFAGPASNENEVESSNVELQQKFPGHHGVQPAQLALPLTPQILRPLHVSNVSNSRSVHQQLKDALARYNDYTQEESKVDLRRASEPDEDSASEEILLDITQFASPPIAGPRSVGLGHQSSSVIGNGRPPPSFLPNLTPIERPPPKEITRIEGAVPETYAFHRGSKTHVSQTVLPPPQFGKIPLSETLPGMGLGHANLRSRFLPEADTAPSRSASPDQLASEDCLGKLTAESPVKEKSIKDLTLSQSRAKGNATPRSSPWRQLKTVPANQASSARAKRVHAEATESDDELAL